MMHQIVSSGIASSIVAEMRAENAAALASAAEESAERLDAYRKRSLRNRRWSAYSGEATATAQLPAAQKVQERAADRILRNSMDRVSNDEYRAARLPRMAQGMASRKGRPANPDTAAQFVSSFSSQFPLVQRLAMAFLPEKISHADAAEIIGRLAGERGFTFDPKDKADAAAFRALMAQVNPGSGRAGGRPRKVRPVEGCVPAYSAKGALYGTYDAGVIGAVVGNLPQKHDGCTCGGLSGSGYRSCAGHGYGRSVTAHPYVGRVKLDGTIVHVGDLAQEDSDSEE